MVVGRFVRPFLISAVLAWLPAGLLAQSGSSTIAGLIKDPSGAAIAAAKVNVVNEDTNITVLTEILVSSLTTLTLAAAIAAPLGSFMRPAIVLEPLWANRPAGNQASTADIKKGRTNRPTTMTLLLNLKRKSNQPIDWRGEAV